LAETHDIAALAALADAFSDAASIHRSAAKIADDEALRLSLTARAVKLEELCAKTRVSDQSEPGTVLRHLDHLKLAVDAWFGDDDEAANVASLEAAGNLLKLIDSYLLDAQISPTLTTFLRETRHKIGRGGATVSPGLSDLPG